eukprot:gene11770-24674_t
MSLPISKMISSGSLEHIPQVCKEIKQLITAEIAISSSGSSGAETFYGTLPILLDRIFGEDTTLCAVNPSWIKGDRGGWLRMTFGIRNDQLASFSHLSWSQVHDKNNRFEKSLLQKAYGLSNAAADLIELLSPHGDIFNFITRLRRDYEMKLEMLPRKTQLHLLRCSEYEAVKTSLYGGYDGLIKVIDTIRVPTTQNATSTSTSIPTSVKLEPLIYFFICLIRYPSMGDMFTTPPSSSFSSFSSSESFSSNIPSRINMNINMSDEHAFNKPYVIEVLLQHGAISWLRGNPYLVLIFTYFQELFSCTHRLESSKDTSTSNLQLWLLKRTDENLSKIQHSYQLQHQHQPQQLSLIADLFLRFALERWADNNLIIKLGYDKLGIKSSSSTSISTFPTSMGFTSVTTPVPKMSLTDVPLLSTTSSTSIGTTTLSSCVPNEAELQCLYLLLCHLHSDPALPSGPYSEQCPWTPAIMIFQQPLFDTLRLIFSRSETIPIPSFALAIQLWLMWLQPWCSSLTTPPNYTTTSSTTSSTCHSQSHGSGSMSGSVLMITPGRNTGVSGGGGGRMSERQEAYMASNLHFYTTLLEMFIGTMSRMKMPPATRARERVLLLTVLEQVLQTFSGDLLGSLDTLISLTKSSYNSSSSSSNNSSHITGTGGGTSFTSPSRTTTA